jgi:hypothetical protein
VQALREVAALAGWPLPVAQATISRALELTLDDPPTDPVELDGMADQAEKAAKAKYGMRFTAMVENARQAVALLSGEHPDIAACLRDVRVLNDLQVVEGLAALGERARTYYTRRFGTSRDRRF